MATADPLDVLFTPYGLALRHTVALLRRRPVIARQWPIPDLRSPDGEALAAWHSSRPVQRWLYGVSYRKWDEAVAGLLGAAKEFLEEEQDRLDAAWDLHHREGTWDRLTPSAQRLGALAFAMAARRGPRVLVSNRAGAHGVWLMTGTRPDIATITRARVRLVQAGVVEVTVGRVWEPGYRARPSEYNLLPDLLRERLMQLCPYPPPRGIVAFPSRPRMEDEQWAKMTAFFTQLRLRHPGQGEVSRDAEPEPAAGLDELMALLEYPPAGSTGHGEPGRGPVATWDELVAMLDCGPAGSTGQEVS